MLVESFDLLIANNLWSKLSDSVEKRSMEYVNRYLKTDMEVAAIIFDRKRIVRGMGLNGRKYKNKFSSK